MRFIFKTDYDQDIRLFKHGGAKFWYGLLAIALVAAPSLLDEGMRDYYLSQMGFICVYAIIGLGLMLLTGFTGQVSLGHAAFLAIGAYAEAILQARGWPFPASLAAAFFVTGIAGIVIGLPALRVKGIYLAIATQAFGFIVEEILARWESLTNGNGGLHLKPIDFFGVAIDTEEKYYFLALGLLVLVLLGTVNLMRSPTGRALVAIRDSEISAQSMGIHLAKYKTIAFALSAAITGVAGALYAHKLQFISPEQFNVLVSIQLLIIIFIGGIGSFHGAIFGAIFMIAMPEAISAAKDWLPQAIAGQPGLESTVFGLILILFILFEPLGIYGRWLKIRTYFTLFPFYRRSMFKRQKAYMKSERLR
jgi:branched-chain amino acid transport system permease protein